MIFFLRAWWATPLLTRDIGRFSSGLQQLGSATEIRRAHKGRLAQAILAGLSLLGQDVTLVGLGALDLAASGHGEALHRGALGLLLGHLYLRCVSVRVTWVRAP